MKADFTDDVSGVIVGDVKTIAFLRYEGRNHGPTIYADNDDDAKAQANEYINELRKEWGQLFNEIWPNKSWTLNFV